MHASTEPVIQPEWATPEDPPPDDTTRWLLLIQRFSFVRAHISVFAMGSVFLLALNLLANPGHVQVDRWISAWAVIVVIHALVAGIATLALQLMADDDIRPASEVHWEGTSTWELRDTARDWPSAPVDAVPDIVSEPEPDVDPWHEPPEPPAADERVSWQAASDAAWLADGASGPDIDTADAPDTRQDEDASTDT